MKEPFVNLSFAGCLEDPIKSQSIYYICHKLFVIILIKGICISHRDECLCNLLLCCVQKIHFETIGTYMNDVLMIVRACVCARMCAFLLVF